MTNRRLLGRILVLPGVILLGDNFLRPPANPVTLILGALLLAAGIFIRLRPIRPQ